MCQFQFCNISHIAIDQNNPKGSKMDFPFDLSNNIILHMEKLKFSSSIFN